MGAIASSSQRNSSHCWHATRGTNGYSLGLGKRIRNPSSDHHLNDHHHDDGRANDNDHRCANDNDHNFYDNHNYYDNHKHGRANDKYFFVCPIGEVLQLFWLIY